MKEYQKINSIYQRKPNKDFIEGKWSIPEFEYLKDNIWIATEKINGRNIGIEWNSQLKEVTIIGRHDDAEELQIANDLNELLHSFFNPKVFNDFCNKIAEEKKKEFSPIITIYGEGMGASSANGGGVYFKNPNSCDFMAFDVNIDGWWLNFDNANDVIYKLIGAKHFVPIIGEDTLMNWIGVIKQKKLMSGVAKYNTGKDVLVEGIVLKPMIELRTRKGERIITKIKHKDWK